jgi:hypothetical protein
VCRQNRNRKGVPKNNKQKNKKAGNRCLFSSLWHSKNKKHYEDHKVLVLENTATNMPTDRTLAGLRVYISASNAHLHHTSLTAA